jgi:hypothetical protein
MKRDTRLIISEIRDLLNELDASLGGNLSVHKKRQVTDKRVSAEIPKGALGAVMILVEEGFFDTPKEVTAVIERMKEIGHYHKLTTISMNLLNLTKRRFLNRFRNKETKKWEYVIRK